MPNMLAPLFAGLAFGAGLVVIGAVRDLLPAARLLLGAQGLAAQSHYRFVTLRRVAPAAISPMADRPQDRRLRSAWRRTSPAIRPCPMQTAAA